MDYCRIEDNGGRTEEQEMSDKSIITTESSLRFRSECTVQKLESAEKENANLRAHLAAANKRLEDAEKQEPVYYLAECHPDDIPLYNSDEQLTIIDACDVQDALDSRFTVTPLYTCQVPPADVAELQNRIAYLDNEASNNADLNNRQAIRIADLARELAEQQASMRIACDAFDRTATEYRAGKTLATHIEAYWLGLANARAFDIVEKRSLNMNAATEASKFATPQLNEGEIYAGAIIKPDGTGHHVILIDGDNDDADWNTQMEWAKSIGGDLPDRVEQSLLFKHLKDRFQPAWYWSNTQHASYSGYAWYQGFYGGNQNDGSTNGKLRARAVRRVAI